MADFYVGAWLSFVAVFGFFLPIVYARFDDELVGIVKGKYIQRALLVWFLMAVLYFRTLSLTQTMASIIFNFAGLIVVFVAIVSFLRWVKLRRKHRSETGRSN